MFYEMCGLETTGNKTGRTNDLCAVEPLEDGPFERVGDRDVWHPNWGGKIDDDVNVQFIKSICDRIWQNEQVSIHFLEEHIDIVTYFVHRGFGIETTEKARLMTQIFRCQRYQTA